MKNTIKLFFVIVLFCATAFAEGNMGGGGFTGDGNMGGGGKTCTGTCIIATETNPDTKKSGEADESESVIKFIQDYLVSIFG